MITSPSIRVLLVPIGSFPLEQAMELARILPERFPIEMEFHVVIWSLTPPLEMYDWERGQFRADELAEYLADSIPLAEPPRLLILGLSDADAYVDGLNFVFGIALPRRGVAIVFSRRLYSASREVYFKRLVKECMHEVGHLLGLPHCGNPRCVMSFSNSLADVDFKEDSFCDDCKYKLYSLARKLNVRYKG